MPTASVEYKIFSKKQGLLWCRSSISLLFAKIMSPDDHLNDVEKERDSGIEEVEKAPQSEDNTRLVKIHEDLHQRTQECVTVGSLWEEKIAIQEVKNFQILSLIHRRYKRFQQEQPELQRAFFDLVSSFAYPKDTKNLIVECLCNGKFELINNVAPAKMKKYKQLQKLLQSGSPHTKEIEEQIEALGIVDFGVFLPTFHALLETLVWRTLDVSHSSTFEIVEGKKMPFEQFMEELKDAIFDSQSPLTPEQAAMLARYDVLLEHLKQ
ncbi:hypothetical protein COW46_03425 [Candidatus Gracilibacteria bacterium CG17_big_fil_post_rev_8_21_14_2_50_48_13]|nr:MAG: hypothetical protein COW46_03425 [Candidatus Gracilibacteria bacterium CG17_big_fil_post_rev_8_21_14_2_50_48_13]